MSTTTLPRPLPRLEPRETIKLPEQEVCREVVGKYAKGDEQSG